jgi:hypothetical protein
LIEVARHCWPHYSRRSPQWEELISLFGPTGLLDYPEIVGKLVGEK